MAAFGSASGKGGIRARALGTTKGQTVGRKETVGVNKRPLKPDTSTPKFGGKFAEGSKDLAQNKASSKFDPILSGYDVQGFGKSRI